jgi:hypothetical protein
MLELANSHLETDPGDLVSLLYKAKALAYSREYGKARAHIAKHMAPFKTDPAVVAEIRRIDG